MKHKVSNKLIGLIIFFAVAFLVLLLVFSNLTRDLFKNESKNGWSIYKSNIIGYSIEIPTEWNVSQKEIGNSSWPEWNLVALPADLGEQSNPNLWINFPIPIDGKHNNDFEKLYEKGLSGLAIKNVPSDPSFFSSRHTSFTTINGKRTLVVKSVNNSNPPEGAPEWCDDCIGIYYYIDLGSKSILPVSCTWRVSVPGINETICNQILLSLKFVE